MPITFEPADIAPRLATGEVVLVDVRDRDEWNAAHVDGAIHMPLDDLDRRSGELPGDRTIAFICRTGKRSATAAEQVAGRGLEAGNVAGGMDAWTEAGLPVERGNNAA